jgi:hypothetical protein
MTHSPPRQPADARGWRDLHLISSSSVRRPPSGPRTMTSSLVGATLAAARPQIDPVPRVGTSTTRSSGVDASSTGPKPAEQS